MENKFIILDRVKNEAEAEILLSLLKDQDIPCKKLQESFGALNGLSFGIFGEIAIAVSIDRLSDAKIILSNFLENDQPDADIHSNSKYGLTF